MSPRDGEVIKMKLEFTSEQGLKTIFSSEKRVITMVQGKNIVVFEDELAITILEKLIEKTKENIEIEKWSNED